MTRFDIGVWELVILAASAYDHLQQVVWMDVFRHFGTALHFNRCIHNGVRGHGLELFFV